MKETFTFLRPLFILTAVFFFALSSLGQTDVMPAAEPSYDVTLQLVIGSNAGGKDEMPQNLSSVGKQIRSSFGFNTYRLTHTIVGRVASTGNFSYKSITNNLVSGAAADNPSFLEWSFASLRASSTLKGAAGITAESLRFGVRLPIATVPLPDARSPINYEAIGVTIGKVAVPENIPTLIGTLELPAAGGTVFMVMTVRQVDN